MYRQNPTIGAKNRSTDKPNRNKGVFTISGDWIVQSERLKEKFPQLSDSDLHFEKGREDVLLTHMAKKLNKHRREVINIIRKENAENE